MTTIFKYPVSVVEDFTLHAPQCAQFLAVQIQNGEPVIWARVDPSRPAAEYRFAVHGTCHSLSQFAETAPYIGTFQLMQGALVFHLFGGVYA